MSYIKGFFSASVQKVAAVNIMSGTITGFIIGYVAVYNTLNTINEECAHYESAEACQSLSFTNCQWTANNACEWVDYDLNCSVHTDQDSCDGNCKWNDKSCLCEHRAGYNDFRLGIFAAAMTVGGMIGALGVAPLVDILGRKRIIILSGIIAVVCSILLHAGRAGDVYSLAVIGRLLSGIPFGALCVASPMYVEEMAPEAYRKAVGTLFQVFVTFGIFLAAVIGVILEPYTPTSAPPHNELRIQIFIGCQTLLSLCVVITGILMSESTTFIRLRDEKNGEDGQALVNRTSNNLEDKKTYTWTNMMGPLLVATALCIAQQMTGINAIMNYAPKITDPMGLNKKKKLLGNCVIMLWNFVTTIGSIPLSSKLSFRLMYVGGVAVALVGLLLPGVIITIYPQTTVLHDQHSHNGSHDNSSHLEESLLFASANLCNNSSNGEGLTESQLHTKQGLAGLGVFLFILAFEMGMGPAFYVLCQQLFPGPFRSKGSSYAIFIQFVFNIIINACFPIAVSSLSENGNEKGVGAVFLFFTATGFVSWLVLVKWLYPYSNEESTTAEGGDLPVSAYIATE